jgi:hypothetical protein
MGQQQLLLIVLGVILVGVAVVLGIQYFNTGAEQGAKDELVAHCQIVASNAQEWFKKPSSMGGGGISFVGFDTEFTTKLVGLGSSTNGTYRTDDESASGITIYGEPTSTLGYNWYVKAIVTPTGVTTSIETGTAPPAS